MEEEFVIELIDHVECLFIIGKLFEMFEDEHDPIFEGVNGMDVLLVFSLDLEERVHKAHSLQVLCKGRIAIVPPKSLQNIFDLLRLLALSLW